MSWRFNVLRREAKIERLENSQVLAELSKSREKQEFSVRLRLSIEEYSVLEDETFRMSGFLRDSAVLFCFLSCGASEPLQA